MSKRILWIAALAAAVTPGWGLASPPAGGTIAIEVNGADGEGGPPRSYADAVAQALAAKGFTIFPDPAHAAYVAELVVTRTAAGTGSTKLPAGKATVLPGTMTASSGVGLSMPIGSGTRLAPLQRTQLTLRIRKRGEGIVWNGGAATIRASGVRQGSDDVVAADLVQATLRSYPAAPDGVVGVP